MAQPYINTDQPIIDGSFQNPYREFTLTLAAGEIFPLQYDFNFARILSLSDSTALRLTFGGSGAETTVVGAGIGFRLGAAIKVLTLRNASASPITVTVGLAIGEIFDDRVNLVGGTIPVIISSPTVIASKADVSVNTASATIIAALNTSRTEVIIQNPIGNTNDFRIGDSGVNATEGIILSPGSTLNLTVTAAIYAYHTKGSAQSIVVNEIQL